MPVIGKGYPVARQGPVAPQDIAPEVVPAETTLTAGKDIEKAATDFEALLLQQMFSSMWSTVPQGGLLSGTREEELFRDMLNEALAKSVAEHQSIGVRDVLAKDMKKLEDKR